MCQVGNHIDVATGKWTATDAGIGAGIDSYFEYLVKGSVLFGQTELIEMFYGSWHKLEFHPWFDCNVDFSSFQHL